MESPYHHRELDVFPVGARLIGAPTVHGRNLAGCTADAGFDPIDGIDRGIAADLRQRRRDPPPGLRGGGRCLDRDRRGSGCD